MSSLPGSDVTFTNLPTGQAATLNIVAGKTNSFGVQPPTTVGKVVTDAGTVNINVTPTVIGPVLSASITDGGNAGPVPAGQSKTLTFSAQNAFNVQNPLFTPSWLYELNILNVWIDGPDAANFTLLDPVQGLLPLKSGGVTGVTVYWTNRIVFTPNAARRFNATLHVLTDVNVGAGQTGGEVYNFALTGGVNLPTQPPTLDPIDNPVAINEDAGLQTINLTGISAGLGESQPLTVAATSGNTALIPHPTINYTSPNATGSLTYTPVPNANGSAVITVTVRDSGPDGTMGNGDDGIATRTFTVSVNAVNDRPSFTKGPNQTVSQDAGPQAVAGWASAISSGPPDEAGQTIAFHVTGNTNPSLFSAGPAVNSSGTLNYTPVIGASGSATITLVARDNGGTANGGVDTSPPQSFTLTVTNGNVPPVIALPPKSQTVVPGNSVTGCVVAGGTPTPSYQWYFNSGIIGGATASAYPITNFQLANEGRYHVVATNAAGSVTSQVAVVYVADPLRFISHSIEGSNFNYRLVGRAGSNFVLEASSTLSGWSTLSTTPAPSGIVDGSVPVGGTNYFRARLLP
jgi:hypothetical protein